MKALVLFVTLALSGCPFCGRPPPPPRPVTPAELLVDGTALDFGDVRVGRTARLELVVGNGGGLGLEVAPASALPFSTSGNVILSPGETRTFVVFFTPKEARAFTGTISFEGSERTIDVKGTGLAIPDCIPRPCWRSTFDLQLDRCVESLGNDGETCTACDATGVCAGGECRLTTAGSCDDGNPCTVDACGANGECVALPRECAVSNGCKVASCNPAVGCVETPIEDGIACGEPSCAEARICLSGSCETRATADAQRQCGYVDVSAHGLVACAKNVAGVTRCWGSNYEDRLLRGAATDSVPPAPWNIGFEVDHFTGEERLCAVDVDGRLLCPGLFDGGSERYRSITATNCGVLRDGGLVGCAEELGPVGRALLSPASRTWTRGINQTECARGEDGGFGCWGERGFLDAGLARGFSFIDLGTAPLDVAVDYGVLALLTDGGVVFHGWPNSPLAPVPRTTAPWRAMVVDTWLRGTVWGLRADGAVDACRKRLDGGVYARPCEPLEGNLRFSKITAGDIFACGLDVQGQVWCWGNNQYGQLGEPAIAQTPRTLALEDVRVHEGALVCWNDGGCEVREWGETTRVRPLGPLVDACRNVFSHGNAAFFLQLDGGFARAQTDGGAVLLQPTNEGYCNVQQRDGDVLTRIDGMSGMNGWSCALFSDGGVSCSGGLPFRGFDAGVSFEVDVHVPMPAMTSLRTAGLSVCARSDNGRVWCWGERFGFPSPGEVALTGVRQLECNDSACCALYGSNGVSCWGENQRNQLGATGTRSTVPRAVSIDEPVTRLNHTARCAHLTSGRVRCWSSEGSEAPFFSSAPLRVMR